LATTVTYHTHQLTYLVNLLDFSNISRTLASSVSKQLFVPRTKLNIGKCAFSVAEPIIWNQLPITTKSSETIANVCTQKTENICLKLLLHNNFWRFHAPMISPFIIMPTDLACCTSELDFLKDIGAIEVLQLLLSSTFFIVN